MIEDSIESGSLADRSNQGLENEVPGGLEVTPPEPTSQPVLKSFTTIRPETKPAPREYHVADFFDLDSTASKSNAEPRAEFNYLLEKVLRLIKENTFASSASFFWVNREKRQLVLEAKACDDESLFSGRRFAIGDDLVSKVAESGKPEILTSINPLSEAEMLPFYSTQGRVKSFVAAPVYFSLDSTDGSTLKPVAVITVDSGVEEAFGTETLGTLGLFTKLCSGLIKSYTEKYDLLLDSEVLASLQRMQEKVRTDFSSDSIMNALTGEISKLVSLDFLSVVLYDEKKRVWMTKRVMNRVHEPYVAPEQIIDFPHSIAGQTIRNNRRSDESPAGGNLPRFHRDERIDSSGIFLSVPLSSVNKCYGCVNLERTEKIPFTQQDLKMISHLVNYATSYFEVLYMNDLIEEYVIIDDVTGVASRKFFLQRVEEELGRANDNGAELSLLLISVDRAPELMQRFGQEGFNRIMLSLAKVIRSSVRGYDIAGRMGDDRLGVVLINTPANDAYLWSEKIRKNVSGQTIEIDGKSFSVTISAGVVGASESVTREDLLSNTLAVLNKAIAAGGNAVRVF